MIITLWIGKFYVINKNGQISFLGTRHLTSSVI